MNRAVFILLVFAIACSEGKKSREEQAIKETINEVMDIHDEVMPRMGELRRVRKELLKKAEELADTTANVYWELKNQAYKIDKANESMMVWMRNFDPTYISDDADSMKTYFEDQKVKMQKVKDDMLGELSKGQELLSKN